MSIDKNQGNDVKMTDAEASQLDLVAQHRRIYLSSGGVHGHIIDNRPIGGLQFTTTLLLQTRGRKTGDLRITPLIYGSTGGEVVIVASKGGADVSPAWYLNLKDMAEVSIQIGAQAFRASWREPVGPERDQVWAFMEGVYPPYIAYQAGTQRRIPLVMVSIIEATELFKE